MDEDLSVSRKIIVGTQSSDKVAMDFIATDGAAEDGMHTTVIKIEPEEPEFSENEEDTYSTDGLPLLSTTETENEIIKTETIDCPSTLQKYTEDEISIAFKQCCKRKVKKPAGQLLLEAVFTTLTQQSNGPNHEEESFLYNLWMSKYKNLFGKNKVKRPKIKRCNLVSVKQSRKRPQPKQQKLTTSKSKFSTISEPNDVIITPESCLNCPESLQSFPEDAICTAFTFCFNRGGRRSKLNCASSKSLFGKVSTFLTERPSTHQERLYLNRLWTLKYKHLLDPNGSRDALKRYSRDVRDKMRNRISRMQKARTLSAKEVKCANSNRSSINDHLSNEESKEAALTQNESSGSIAIDNNEESNANAIKFEPSYMELLGLPPPKIEVESDENNAYSDLDNAPLSPTISLHGNQPLVDDPKLKKKVVVVIKQAKQDDGESPARRTSTRRKQKTRRYYNDISSRESEQDNFIEDANDVEMDSEDDVPLAKRIRKVIGLGLKEVSKVPDLKIDNKTGKNSIETTCSVCGRPLSKSLLSFHLRTHFSFEEQKQFLLKRREKEMEIKRRNAKSGSLAVTSKETSLDNRIDQLKRLLAGLEKRVAKNNPEEAAAKKKNIRKRNIYEKRDGNYGPVQCDECGQVLRNVYTLKTHKLAKHSFGEKDQRIKCQICGKPFAYKHILRLHLVRHLNLEEFTRFNKWPGSIEEFLERLNTGQDLMKPPTRKRGKGRPKKPGAPPRKMPRKQGRPRKEDTHKQKDSCDDNTVNITEQVQTTDLSKNIIYSNQYAAFNVNSSNDDYGGLEFRAEDAVPSTSGATVDASVLNWGYYTDQ